MNPKPLNLKDLWAWFEKKFGVDAMNRCYGYETEELIKEIKQRMKSAVCGILISIDDIKREIEKKKTRCYGKEETFEEIVWLKDEELLLDKIISLIKLAFKDVLGEGND